MQVKLGFEASPALREALEETAAVLRSRSPGQSISLSDVMRLAVIELHRATVQPVAKPTRAGGTSHA
jgi:hypothetical protein